MSRKLMYLGLGLFVAIAGWTGAWFYIRSEVAHRMDDGLDRLRSRGVAIECPNRRIGGWPFRIDVDCTNPTLAMTDRLTRVAAKGLRVTALIYQPTRAIIELDGPLSGEGPNGEDIKADWKLLQASVSLSSGRLDQAGVVSDLIRVTMARPGGPVIKFDADHGELHGRTSPGSAVDPADYDLAARFVATTTMRDGKVLGPVGSDVDVDAVARRLPARSEPGESFLKTWFGNDGRIDLTSVRYQVAGFTVEGQGTLGAAADGQVKGSIKLVASGFSTLLAIGAKSFKGRAEVIALAGAFTLFGKASDGPKGARALDFKIDQGLMSIGGTQFGRVPSLF